MKALEQTYNEIEANIADEITFIIRWGTSKYYFSGTENLGSEAFGRLKIDLQGAFSTAYINRLATFFQDGKNNLGKFVNLAEQLKKINKAESKSLKNRFKALSEKEEVKTLHTLRKKVFAHWDNDLPKHLSQPIEINIVIKELLEIFEASGGRKIDEAVIQKDVKQGWQDLIREMKAL